MRCLVSKLINYFTIENFSNPTIVQKPRHADDHILYLHTDNTVIDVYDAKSD